MVRIPSLLVYFTFCVCIVRGVNVTKVIFLLLKSNSLDRRLGVELLSSAVALQGVEQTLGFAMEHCVDGVLAGDVLYVRIFNGGMLFGEAIAVQNDADLLFAVESINQVYHIYNMRVRVKGDINRLKSCFKNLFTDLECE